MYSAIVSAVSLGFFTTSIILDRIPPFFQSKYCRSIQNSLNPLLLPSVAIEQNFELFSSKLLKAASIEFGASIDVMMASVFIQAQKHFDFVPNKNQGMFFFSKEDEQSMDEKLL